MTLGVHAEGMGFRKMLGRAEGDFLLKVGNILVTTTTKIFAKVLQSKWETYCNTNGTRIAIQMGVLTVFPFLGA